MEYNEFKKCVVESVERELQGKDKVEIHSVLRNNAGHLDGLMVMREGSSIAPALYLDQYYEEYEKGSPLSSIVGEITDFYKSGRDRMEQADMDFYKDYEQVKDHIYAKLIHYDRNRELLATVPHIRTLDLAIVFYCRLYHKTMGNIMIQIYNSHLDLWQAEIADLYRIAMKNTREKLPVELKSMNTIVREMMLQDAADISKEDIEEAHVDEQMYVLTNYLRQYGAVCMLYPNVLAKFAMTVGGDFFILPSSVHEVLLLPARDGYQKEKLEALVQQVNREQVAPDEVLSDTVYRFSRKMKKILY